MIRHTARPASPPSPRGRETGSALLWAVSLMSATVALVLSDMDTMRAGSREQAAQFAESGQASGVAQAGLNDALAWLRRQRLQPVTVFAPQRDLTADPPVNETDDPAIGLVREYEITPGVWGRYEVRTGRSMDPFVDANQNGRYDAGETFTDLLRPPGSLPASDEVFIAGRQGDGYGDGLWTPSRWSRDVSVERGATARGTVWRLESRGLVFRRERDDLPLGQDPNVLLASSTATSEVRRLVMTPPATSAICAPTTGSVVVGDRVRLRAPGGLAIGVGSLSGTLSLAATAEVVASTRYAAVPGYDASVKRVFGVEWPELKALADLSSRRVAGIPDAIREGSMVVLERDVVYSAELPLEGSGLLIVKGNLTLEANSKSYFSGVLYVQGNVTIYAPALVRGQIICTGRVELRGSTGDYVEVESDPAAVTRLLGAVSAYRFARAVYSPDRRLLDSPGVLSDPWTPEPDPIPSGGGATDGTGGASGTGTGGSSDSGSAGTGSGSGSGTYVPPPSYGDEDDDDDRPPRRRHRGRDRGRDRDRD